MHVMFPLTLVAVEIAPSTDEDHSTAKKIKELLESVGASTGSSSKKHEFMISATVSSATVMAEARFRKINTTHYREVHEDIQKRLKDVARPVKPEEAATLVKKMITHETYRRKCGSRILCLDGGGVRGLIQMTILREIERRTQKKIVDLFDWIVGTSTGGIIALALSYGMRISLVHLQTGVYIYISHLSGIWVSSYYDKL